jgi:hypothetical protein
MAETPKRHEPGHESAAEAVARQFT